MGSTTKTGDLSPIYLFLLLGILVGGLGIGAMLLGMQHLARRRRSSHQQVQR